MEVLYNSHIAVTWLLYNDNITVVDLLYNSHSCYIIVITVIGQSYNYYMNNSDITVI